MKISARNRAPLAGIRVLVGRARHQASALSVELKKLGAEVIEIPFIEIRPPRSYKPFDTALKRISKYDWLILTSVNGVNALGDRMKRLRIKPEQLKRLKIAAIGPATRDAIKDLRLRVSVVPKNYVAESVVESLRGKVEGHRVLLVRAKVARDVIPRELRAAGARVNIVEAYETVVPANSRRRLRLLMKNSTKRLDVITFTSSSTVTNFVELLRGEECPRDIKLASIGPVTSSTLRDFDLTVKIEAKEYTIPGLVRAIVAAYASR